MIKGFALALKIYLSAITLKALELDFNLVNFVFFYLTTTPKVVLKDVKFAELKLLAFLVGALKCNRRVVICIEQQADGAHRVEELLFGRILGLHSFLFELFLKLRNRL